LTSATPAGKLLPEPCRADLGSLDRPQVAIEPGQSLFDEFISRWGVVGSYNFNCLSGAFPRGRTSAEWLLGTTNIEFPV
jgi:hypothetical protein